jgi:nitrite reductase/ring-hydroxylating ferredoxin subunit
VSEVQQGFERVAALRDVPDGGCLAVEWAGVSLVLVRRGEVVTAMENRCPHAGAPLSEGFVAGPTITCAWHGFTFDLDTGRSVDETGLSVPMHEARVVDGQVLVRA